MATIMITRICDGRNEFDLFIIKGEWFQKLSFPVLNPNFFDSAPFWMQAGFQRSHNLRICGRAGGSLRPLI
jgi:hypothetical protein